MAEKQKSLESIFKPSPYANPLNTPTYPALTNVSQTIIPKADPVRVIDLPKSGTVEIVKPTGTDAIRKILVEKEQSKMLTPSTSTSGETIRAAKPIEKKESLSKIFSFFGKSKEEKDLEAREDARLEYITSKGLEKDLSDIRKIKQRKEDLVASLREDTKIDLRNLPGTLGKAGNFIEDVKAGVTDTSKSDIPVLGTLYDAANISKIILLDSKIKNNTISNSEKAWLNDYLDKAEEEEKKQEDIGYKIGATVRGSGTFMTELGLAALASPATAGGSLAAFGVAKLSSKTAKEIIEKLLKDKVTRDILKSVAKNSLKKVGKESLLVAGLRTPEGALERIAGTKEFNENGEFTGLANDGQPVPNAIINAITDNIVEVTSERSGELLGFLGRPIKNSIIKAGILGATKKANPNLSVSAISSLFRTAGWNGVLTEFAEERVGDVLRGGLTAVGLNDQEFKLPSLNQVAVEIASFSLMGAGIKALEKAEQKGIQPGLSIKDVSKDYYTLDNQGKKVYNGGVDGLDEMMSEAKAIQFVSPNVEENLTFEKATSNMSTPSYENNFKKVDSSYANDGIEGVLKKGRGDWATGAEETYIKVIINEVSDEKRIYALSKNARELNQIDAIDFKYDINGSDEIYRIDPNGKSVEEVKQILDDNDIKYKTLGDNELYVVNRNNEYFDKTLIDKMKKISNDNNIDVTKSMGVSTFITGLENDRTAAQTIYNNIINNYEQKYGIQGRTTKTNQGNTISGEPISGTEKIYSTTKDRQSIGLKASERGRSSDTPYPQVKEVADNYEKKYGIQGKPRSRVQENPDSTQLIPGEKSGGITKESTGEKAKRDTSKKSFNNLERLVKEKIISPEKVKVGNLINIINETTNETGRVSSVERDAGKTYIRMDDIRRLISLKDNDANTVIFKEKTPQPPSLRELGVERPQAKKITKMEDVLLRDQVRAEARAVKLAAPSIRAQLRTKILTAIKNRQGEVSSVKNSIMEFAKTIPLEKRGKLLATMKNAKTFADLNKAEAFIQSIAEETTSKGTISDIINLLNKTKPTKQGGKPVGKYPPVVQRTLDIFRVATSLSREEAQELANKNLDNYGDTFAVPDDIALQNRILTMASGLKDMNSSELKTLYNTIAEIEENGKLTKALQKFNRDTDVQTWREQAIDIITGGNGIKPGTGTVGVQEKYAENPATWAEARKKAMGKLDTLGKTFVGWRDILDMISSKDKSSEAFSSWLNNFGETLEEENAYTELLQKYNEKLARMFSESYSLKNGKDVNKKMAEDTEPINLGVFENSEGEAFEFILTKAEARKRWMELKDPTLESTFREGMLYTDDMIEVIDNFLTKEDKAFAEAQLDLYQETYEIINEVYRDIYGADLPYNPVYSPISRGDITREKANDVLGAFNMDMQTRRSASKGALISRVKNKKIIETRSDVQVLQSHVAEMMHFVTWAKKVKDLNAVFSDSKVMAAIKQEYGQDMNAMVHSFLIDFARGGAETAKNFNFFDKIRIRFTQGVLAVKPSIAVKQLVSFVAYADYIPVKEFVKGEYDFWKNPIDNYRFLKENSPLFRARGENMDRDIKSASKSDAYLVYRKKQNFLNSLMLNIRLGDQASVVIGGWSVYKYNHDKAIKEGKSEKEAKEIGIREFELATKTTQQSAALSDLSSWQRNPITKIFTMFTSSQNQYFRKELGAFRNLAAGRMSAKQFSKTIFIYHFLLPMIFQLVSDFGRWDEKEQKRAMFLGSLNGLFIVTDGLEYLIRKGMNMKPYDGELEQPIMSIFRDLGKPVGFAYDYVFDDVTTEDFYKALEGLLDATGKATGLPTGYGWDLGKGINELIYGSWDKGLGMLAGWSEYVMDKRNEKGNSSSRKAELDKIFKGEGKERDSLDNIFK